MPRQARQAADSRGESSSGERIQFSISMTQPMRQKVETLAGLRHMSISDYVNMVMEAHLGTISESTWEQIRKAEQALQSEGIRFKKRE